MIKLSVVISAYNEEEKIKDCLESVKDIANEIIFVDNSSIDNTAKIAEKYTDKIFIRKNNLMLNVNKNFGFTKATGEWVLCLDADERVSPELAKEIGNWKLEIGNSRVSGFWIPRKNIIFGKWMQHTGWHPDYQMRLFRKNKGRFEERNVHEMIKIDGETDYLKEHLIHYNYETISQFLYKLNNIYVPSEVEDLLKKGYEFNSSDAIRFPLKEFLSRFFAREGYKDGFHGLIMSMLMSFYHFIIFAKIWENEGFREIKDKEFIEEIHKEIKEGYKQISFWVFNERIKDAPGIFKKSWLRIKRSLS